MRIDFIVALSNKYLEKRREVKRRDEFQFFDLSSNNRGELRHSVEIDSVGHMD